MIVEPVEAFDICHLCKDTVYTELYYKDAIDDYVEVWKCLNWSSIGLKQFTLHTSCLHVVTQNSEYIPDKHTSLSFVSCAVCAEAVNTTNDALKHSYIAFFRDGPTQPAPKTGYDLYFHMDCFVSIAGDILPLKEEQ